MTHPTSPFRARALEPRRHPRRSGLGLRRPAERGRLDTLAGLTLWLTLTHGFAGTGIGFVIGLLLGPNGASA